MDELWDVFIQSGSVEDYLKYKESLKNADDGKGLDNQGTDGRGE